MEAKHDINKKIEEMLNSVETIGQANISPFFKDKTMRRIFEAKQEEKSLLWSWFTPQLQLATLACVVALNVFTLVQLQSDNSENELSDFAENYGLSAESSESLIN